MDESTQLILRKVIALGRAVMLVVTLAAIAVVKADHEKPTNVASGSRAGSSSDVGTGTGDETQGGDAGTAAQAANNGGGGAAGGGSGAAAAAGAGGQGGAARGKTPAAPGQGRR